MTDNKEGDGSWDMGCSEDTESLSVDKEDGTKYFHKNIYYNSLSLKLCFLNQPFH